MIIAYTDYPFVELGDKEGEQAPVRPVIVVEYDGDKYAKVMYNGITEDVKTGYLYSQSGQYGEVPRLDPKILRSLYEKSKGEESSS